jgi:hypothetical protein
MLFLAFPSKICPVQQLFVTFFAFLFSEAKGKNKYGIIFD